MLFLRALKLSVKSSTTKTPDIAQRFRVSRVGGQVLMIDGVGCGRITYYYNVTVDGMAVGQCEAPIPTRKAR